MVVSVSLRYRELSFFYINMDIDNCEWWYSEGEAPNEEWDEPTPRDV